MRKSLKYLKGANSALFSLETNHGMCLQQSSGTCPGTLRKGESRIMYFNFLKVHISISVPTSDFHMWPPDTTQ